MSNDNLKRTNKFTIENVSYVRSQGDGKLRPVKTKQNICFVYEEVEVGEENGEQKYKLKKIGDGMYGSVYKGATENVDTPNIAIKVLYNNSEIHPRDLKILGDGELDQIFGRLVDKYNLANGVEPQTANDPKQHVVDELKNIVKGHKKSSGSLVKAIFDFYDNKKKKEKPPSFADFWDDLEKGANSTAVYRYEVERDLNQRIKRLLETEVPPIKISDGNIIEVLGGCDNFQQEVLEKDAILKTVFAGSSISYSDYVIVTKLYDCSLKDLLELPIKDLLGLPTSAYDRKSGYEILRELPHDLRAREAFLILSPVAVALQTLHRANFFHRDIKPGNIFILVLTGENRIEIVLADLGNLPPKLNPGDEQNLDYTLRQEKPERDYSPGTINYRGPEQKYHRDVADVEVVNLPADDIKTAVRKHLGYLDSDDVTSRSDSILPTGAHGTPGKPAIKPVLIVKDPKFKNTLFAKGDVVIFSKDESRTEHTIEDVIEETDVEARGVQDNAGKFRFVAFVLASNTVKKESKTQAVLYKKQEYRTDLFSFGAVLFDMLTVGHSAELFYEGLRKYEGRPIRSILDRYDTLRGGEIDETNLDFADLFSPFHNEHDPDNPYPQRDVMEILLKCMLYKSPGTYYYEATKDGGEPREASKKLREDIVGANDTEGLLEKYLDLSKQYQLGARRSILLYGDKSDRQITSSKFFNYRLDVMQGIGRWEEVTREGTQVDINTEESTIQAANRLLYGAYDFFQLTKFVRDEIVKQTLPGTAILYQILPSFLLYSKDHKNLYRMTAPIIDLQGSLRNRSALLISSASSAFVPNEIAGMRRSIRLLLPKQKEADGLTMEVSYRFLDAAVVYRIVRPGDWIVINMHVWKVVSSPPEDGKRTIKLQWVKEELPNSDEPSRDNNSGSTNSSTSKEDSTGTAENPAAHRSEDMSPNGDDAVVREVKPNIDEIQELFRNKGYVDATYYAAIDPLKYYFEMLALYLQHLIFAYSPVTQTTRDRIDIQAMLHTFEIGPPFALDEPEWTKGRNNLKAVLDRANNKLEEIHKCFVDILVRLTLHEAKGSYYCDAGYKPESSTLKIDFFDQVRDAAEWLYERVRADILKIEGGSNDDYRPPITSVLDSDFGNWVNDLAGDKRIDIERVIKRSGQIIGENLAVQEADEAESEETTESDWA